MTFDQARRVADAVLTEGSWLHPYCSAELRNQVRWQFGVLVPPAGGTAQISKARTECLVAADRGAELDIRLRFLRLSTPSAEDEPGSIEEIEVPGSLGSPSEVAFELPGSDSGDEQQSRRQMPLSGLVRVGAQPLNGLWRVRVEVENRTSWGRSTAGERDEMLVRSMVSAHTLLAVDGGEFVSLLAPPEWARKAAEDCRNLHTYPVLVGEGRQVVLSSPVILDDHPEVSTGVASRA